LQQEVGGGGVPIEAERKQALTAEPDYVWSKAPGTVRKEFSGRLTAGNHPDDVFKQIIGEIGDHLAAGQINNRDAHRAANEALGRYIMTAKKTGTRKQAWSGWGPSQHPKRHKVAGWEWDNHLNGFVSTSPRRFECSCGEPVEVPDYTNCKCGKIWNTYVIGTGGDKHQASAEKFIAREIPSRDGVIVAKRKNASDPFPQTHYDDYDHALNDWEYQEETERAFPSKHVPKVDTRSKGVQDGKTTKDWHSRDHSSQQFRSRG
jgi:hypothetical protein